jgi:hypothetical protein
MSSDLVKLQHYVPQFYLRAWATRKKLWVLQDRKIFQSNVRNVAAQNYFYRLHDLCPEDIQFVREMAIENSPEGLKSGHEFLLNVFTLPHRAKRVLEQSDREKPEAHRLLEQVITNMNENYHGSIESDFKHHVDALIAGDLRFLEDIEQEMIFYRGLAVQMLRTNAMKRAKAIFQPAQYETFLRVSNVVMQILAVNLGLNLYTTRKENRIVLLDNHSSVPFVTADQPIINIAANPNETAPPKGFELYYPLSPRRAMLLLEPNSSRVPAGLSVSAGTAHMYNLSIAAHSHYQVFASAPEELEAIRSELDAYLSCFPSS